MTTTTGRASLVGRGGAPVNVDPKQHELFNGPRAASLYASGAPLDGTLGLGEFQECAVARMELLQFIDRKCGGIEQTSVDAVIKKPDVLSAVKAKLFALFSPSPVATAAPPPTTSQQQQSGVATAAGVISTQRLDDISHFTLRLAFSGQDSEKKFWFIRQECRLLHVRMRLMCDAQQQHMSLDRFTSATAPSQSAPSLSSSSSTIPFHLSDFPLFEKFLSRQGITHPILYCGTDMQLRPSSTIACTSSLRDSIHQLAPSSSPYLFALKVPFWPDAAQFVRRKRCYLSNGYAYIPFEDIEDFIVGRFRRILLDSFALLATREGFLQRAVFTDPRLAGLFKALQRDVCSFTAPRDSGAAPCERLSPENAALLTQRSFPPCMRRVADTLRTTGHLKYNGRLQLWLFYKGCGMTMEEQLAYWKSLWHEPEKFDKQHKYNIRHSYGLEGKRAQYSSYPCSKLITGLPIPGVDEVHGCPFRLFDRDPLRQLIHSYGIHGGSSSMDKILELAAGQHYELSCVEFFKATHPGSAADNIGNAPMAYYKESCNHWQRANKTATEQQQKSSKENQHPSRRSFTAPTEAG